MNSIEVFTKDIEIPDWINSIEPFIQNILKAENEDNTCCSITFCSNIYIADLNKIYRDKEGPTDVLSFCERDESEENIPFPNQDELESLGDIIISLEQVQENAEYFSVSYEEELRRVIIHGVLHLIGYDHESNNTSQEPMLQHQEKLLQAGETLF
ncbi:rRNA maturation RNase YbeY [Spirochaeta dissipatitropha]